MKSSSYPPVYSIHDPPHEIILVYFSLFYFVGRVCGRVRMAAPPAALVAGVVVLPCERRDERRLYDTHRCVSGILVGHNGSYCIVLVPSSSIKDPNRERGDERRLPSPQSSREVQASVALSLCATTHPFHTKFTEGFSIRFSVSETTMRPNPNRVGPNGGPSAGHRS